MAGVTRWSEASNGRSARAYAEHFDRLAASGADIHGEARLCASLVVAPARVLDAGCGAGRIAIRLAELGYDCVGVDIDPGMVAEATRRRPELSWVTADLATLDLDETFDLVVAAGNVIPLVAEGTEAAVVARLAAQLRPGALLVAGFGLDAAHLPLPEPTVGLASYDAWCAAAGLTLVDRYASWDREPYDGGGYAVSVHRLP
jgi:SAM-dependent methyltransferase